MEPILKLSNVSYSYHTPGGETKALADLSFTLMPGEFTAVVGPSGCGKSTLLSLIAGLMQPESGNMSLGGIPLTENSSKIGYMLQHDHLFEWRTVYSNILLGLEIQHAVTREKKEKAEEMMRIYGLDGFRDARPSQLSGGMRQRAALIRTLVMEPALVLLDEPFSALDYQTRLLVSDDIGKIIRREGKTALLVTHDISEAISMADRVLVLTKRPARIQAEIPLSFQMEQRSPMACRSAPEFKNYFNQIWKELNKNEN